MSRAPSPADEILVVEDDFDTLDVMQLALSEAGYTVLTAANGREALSLLDGRASLPSLVIIDLMMPLMDGWELTAEMGKTPRLAAIPIVTMSAQDTLPEAGAAAHLRKPISLRDLLELVARFCPGHR